jgi:hypothetical protein
VISWLVDISGVFTFEDSLLMNVFDLNLTKNCNIILCTFSLYSVNKLSCKRIKYLSYLLKKKKEQPTGKHITYILKSTLHCAILCVTLKRSKML